METKSHNKISEVPYTGPKKTMTQGLTKDEISDLLDGYEKTDFHDLKPFHHIRYYGKNKKTGQTEFKIGGTIIKINDEKKYVVLSSGSLSWSVQKDNTVFYQAVPLSVMKERLDEQYQNVIHKKTAENIELLTYVKNLQKTIEKLNEKNNILETSLTTLQKKYNKIKKT